MSEDRVYDSLGAPRRRARIHWFDKVAQAVKSELASGKGWIGDQSFARTQDVEIWNKVMRDAVVAKAVMLRLHMVASPEWYLEAADDESKACVPYYEDLLNQIEDFPNALIQMAKAVFVGRVWLRMVSEKRPMCVGGEREERQWWFPKLYPLMPHFIRDEYEDEWMSDQHRGRYLKRTRYWSTYDPNANDGEGEWLRVEHPEQYVKLTYQAGQLDLGQGSPLLDSLYVYWHAKTHILKQLLKGVERFGYPWIHLALSEQDYIGDADGQGDQFPGSGTQARRLVAAIEKMKQSNVLVTGVESKIQPIDLNGEGARGMIAILEYCDAAIVELVLGSSMPSGGGQSVGSLARAQVEQSTTSGLIRYDRLIVEQAMKQLLWALKTWNKDNLTSEQAYDQQTGRYLWSMRTPRFCIAREDRDDFGVNKMRLDTLAAWNAPIGAKDYYRLVGVPRPEPDEETITPIAAPGAAAPGDMGAILPETMGAAEELAGSGIRQDPEGYLVNAREQIEAGV